MQRRSFPLLAVAAVVIAVAGALAMLAPGIAGAQAAPASGLSASQAFIFNNGGFPLQVCGLAQNPANVGPSSSYTCSSPTTNSTAFSSATSSNALRSQTNVASVTPKDATTKALASTGASSTLASQLDVTGTPMAGDNLVFRFMTTQSATGIGGGFLTGSDVWRLLLRNANTTDSAKVGQQFTSTGTADPLVLTNATQFAGGYDLFLPFAAGNTFFYNFQSLISCPDNQQPAGAAASCALDVNLAGITAQDANGATYAAATFDQTTGFGTINLAPTTVPEPSSLALLATGLFGLVPMIRRKRSKV
ncbi:MAG: PEP-CTERM sorting domain-containing protein [Gemmatimonadaceae bacterium]